MVLPSQDVEGPHTNVLTGKSMPWLQHRRLRFQVNSFDIIIGYWMILVFKLFKCAG